MDSCKKGAQLCTSLALLGTLWWSEAHAACADESLNRISPVQETLAVSPIDVSQSENATSVSMDLDFAMGQDDLTSSLTAVQIPASLSVSRIFWRYKAKVANLDVSNLKINYQLDSGGYLVSAADPSSKIGMSVVSRYITVKNRKRSTVFDAYVDLVFDYGGAKTSGTYTGNLTITVDCNP